MRRVARQGAAGLYAGEVADAIDEWMRANGGLLSRQDLADYHPTFGEPLRQTFRDNDIACVSTPSGAITSLEIFGILNQLDLSQHAHNSAPYLHTLIEAARPALVLTDIGLPGMDGLELTRRLKANPATCRLPVVAVTARALQGDEERALGAGCDAYVAKPVDTRALRALVNALARPDSP
jgi:CheY-like chemotaxis protein